MILFFFLLPWLTWILYLAVMSLKSNRAELTIFAKIMAYPLLWAGLLMDALLNISVMSVLFIEPPREWLFTARCKRHLYSASWRGRQARWWCANFLDPFDKNDNHCGR